MPRFYLGVVLMGMGKQVGNLPQRRLLATAIGLAVASWAGAGMAAEQVP